MTARGRVPIAVLAALALALAAGAAGAQSISTDEGSLFGSSSDSKEEGSGEAAPLDTDSLFGGEVLSEETADAELTPAERPAVEIGGSYRFSLAGQANWSSPEALFDDPLEPESQRIALDLGATVFLDARPVDDFRVFGKADLRYPFVTDAGARPPRAFEDIVTVTELFSDFTVGDRLFLRGGKHTIAWGVGYFFSPADVLNLTAIDPDDPEAEREGPVSLRANLPIGVHNLYLYVLADPTYEGVTLAAAPKAEVVVGGTELGIGAFYHPDRVPRAMLTVSTSLADYELFGELEASYGSERTFVERAAQSEPGGRRLRTVQYTDRLFAAATGGLRYRYVSAAQDWSASFAGQYLWNGEGYADVSLLREEAGVAALLRRGEITGLDLTFPGRHYGAASLTLSLGRRSDWSLGAFWMSNLSDGSGRLMPSVTFRPADRLSLRAAATVTYGADGAEMTPRGSRVGASLTATLGSGRF